MLSFLHIPIRLIKDMYSTDDALLLSYIYASTASKHNNIQEHINGYAWCWDPQHIIANNINMSLSTLKRCVSRLKERGMLVVEQLNSTSLDHTNYYRLTDDALAYFLTKKDLVDQFKKNQSIGSKRTGDYIDTNTHTITHTISKRNIKEKEKKNTVATSVADSVFLEKNKFSDLEASNESNLQDGIALGYDNKNSIQTTSDAIQDVFERFWMLYPRKIVKSEANKLFRKLKIEDAKKIVDYMISGRIKFSQEPKFIPYPTTFLRQKRYLDVLDAPTIQQVYEFAASFRNDTKWARRVAEDYCKSNTIKDYQDYVKSYFYVSKF